MTLQQSYQCQDLIILAQTFEFIYFYKDPKDYQLEEQKFLSKATSNKMSTNTSYQTILKYTMLTIAVNSNFILSNIREMIKNQNSIKIIELCSPRTGSK